MKNFSSVNTVKNHSAVSKLWVATLENYTFTPISFKIKKLRLDTKEQMSGKYYKYLNCISTKENGSNTQWSANFKDYIINLSHFFNRIET